MVATKTALSVRIDALSDADTKSADDAPIAGIANRARLESRLRALEQGMGITNVRRATAGTSMNKTNGKFELRSNGTGSYNTAADTLIPSQPTGTAAPAADESTMEVDGDASTMSSKKSKKDKKRKRSDVEAEFEQEASTLEAAAPAEGEEADEKERKRLKKEAKLAKKANKMEAKAAAEIGDVSLATTAAGDTTKADESMLKDPEAEAERKRAKKEKKEKKKKEKGSA